MRCCRRKNTRRRLGVNFNAETQRRGEIQYVNKMNLREKVIVDGIPYSIAPTTFYIVQLTLNKSANLKDFVLMTAKKTKQKTEFIE
jgi:hypothetical protein